MAITQNNQKSLFDSLYCDEEKLVEIEGNDVVLDENSSNEMLLEQDLLWDNDEQLKSLFIKEKETFFNSIDVAEARFSLCLSRKEAIEWMLKIKAHFEFSALTAMLGVNYLDRFISSLNFEKNKQQPWMMQLVAVTCLSLAAKVEETHVPLLLDLQVGGTEYMFEAKTIQRMELLVLSSLKWRMNPVTPISFLDHIIRRLGLDSWEFLQNCENLLLSVVSDPRFVIYLPSVLANAVMLHVIHQVEPYNATDYENQLFGVLKISKEEVDDCYEFISNTLSTNTLFGTYNPLKRKFYEDSNSPSSITDEFFNSDSSNESWEVESCITSTPPQLLYKKNTVQEQKMKLPSLSRVFVNAIGSPH